MNGSLFINKTYSRSELKGLLEAILFVKGKPVAVDELMRIFEATRQEMTDLIEESNRDYLERKNGFTIIPVAGGFQIVSSPVYKEELAELFGRRNENRLPKSALETLAIIAYKQPLAKEEVDKIRGVSSTRSINTLLALKLITITGAAEDLVKSPLFSTTDRFLEFFRIQSVDDLPSLSSIDMNQYVEDFGDEDESDDAVDPAGISKDGEENTIFNS